MKLKIMNELPSESVGYYTFLNHTSFRNYVDNKYNSASISGYYIDGSILFWYLNFILRAENVKRLSFDNASLAPKVFELYSDRSIFILGASPAENIIYQDNFSSKYPHIDATFIHGYMSFEHYIERIQSCKTPKLVIVGLGSPKQEQFLELLSDKKVDCVAFTCGAYITQSAKRWDYYRSSQGLGRMRVLWRLLDEPQKIIKRLTCDVIWFLQNRKAIKL